MCKKIIIVFIWGMLVYANAQAILLDSLVESIIEQELGTASFSLVVKNPETGEIVYDYNGSKNLTPASNTKLYPAIAGLMALGREFKYKTELGYNAKHLQKGVLKGNLYFRFSGDPSFRESDLSKMIASLKQAGIRRISGNVIVDDKQFEPPHFSPGMSIDDMGWYYAAPTPAIIINENAFRVYFRANAKENKLITVKPLENTYGVKLVNHARTVAASEAEKHCDIAIRHRAEDEIGILGCWPISKKERIERLSVPDPFFWFANILQSKFKHADLVFTGRVQRNIWPKDVAVNETHYSKPLKQLLKHMLYESDNLYADSLEKKLGYEYRRHGNFKEGAYAIKQILKELAGLKVDKLVLNDGAGTRYNMTTAKQLVELLDAIYQDDNLRDPFVDALPQSGVRGSLRDRLNDPDLRGNVFAKTGTMHDISSLAGYLLMPNQKPLIFAMITNHYSGSVEHLKRIEDSILRILWTSG